MLSLDEFTSLAAALCERWKEINHAFPSWRWIPCETIGATCKEEGYLAMENVHLYNVVEKVSAEVVGEEENNCAKEEPMDDATLVQSYSDSIHIYDYHIVYSFSYRVPVLYFRGYQLDGQPLKLDDIEKDLPPYSLNILRESKWTFMTQEDHPYLRRPWYTLHPCGTGDFMKSLLVGNLPKEDQNIHYLSAWLSVVGQVVGLKIPLELHNKSLQNGNFHNVKELLISNCLSWGCDRSS